MAPMEKVQNQDVLMSGTAKNGFSLIEILVVLGIIALLMTIVLPRFSSMLPGRDRKLFITNLNSLTRNAWQQALIQNKIHKVAVDFIARKMWLERETGVVKDNAPEFARVKGAYTMNSCIIPKNIEIENFIVEGYDEKARSRTTYESWFYVMPDGLTQAVTINCIDKKQIGPGGRPAHFGLVLNPFNAQFKVYGSFQK
jgi:prepilin-type N-terminal cleavage/methylation domain-containing protein